MKKQTKILIVIALVIAVVAVLRFRNGGCCTKETCPIAPVAGTQPASSSQPAAATQPAPATGPLPKLLDLGSTTCIPCKRMEPILDELRREYAGRMDVEFVDVRRTPDLAKYYGIRVIPTQILISADGDELDRHEGFISKEDILEWWKESGVTFTP